MEELKRENLLKTWKFIMWKNENEKKQQKNSFNRFFPSLACSKNLFLFFCCYFSLLLDDTTHIQKMCELFAFNSMNCSEGWQWERAKKFFLVVFIALVLCCCWLYCEKFIAIKLKEIKANCELCCVKEWREKRERKMAKVSVACIRLLLALIEIITQKCERELLWLFSELLRWNWNLIQFSSSYFYTAATQPPEHWSARFVVIFHFSFFLPLPLCFASFYVYTDNPAIRWESTFRCYWEANDGSRRRRNWKYFKVIFHQFSDRRRRYIDCLWMRANGYQRRERDRIAMSGMEWRKNNELYLQSYSRLSRAIQWWRKWKIAVEFKAYFLCLLLTRVSAFRV